MLEPNVNKLLNWFRQSGLLVNSDTSLFLTSLYERSLEMHDSGIKSSSSEEILGVLIDSEFTFMTILQGFALKIIRNFVHWARVSKYMTLQKRRLLMSSYIISQFTYCDLVWMIHNRKLNKIIRSAKEHLRIVYTDHKTSFSELLKIDKSVAIYQNNLQYLLKFMKLKRASHQQ